MGVEKVLKLSSKPAEIQLQYWPILIFRKTTLRTFT